MARYISQCLHRANPEDIYCKTCGQKIQRIWNIDKLGTENAIKLAKAWHDNIKPWDYRERYVFPVEREEYVYIRCAEWDDANPNADESTRVQAFKQIISEAYRNEYELSVKDKNIYYRLMGRDKRRGGYIHL